MANVQKVRISRKDDRLTVASVLVENGYQVWLGKEKREGTRGYDYCIYFTEQDAENAP